MQSQETVDARKEGMFYEKKAANTQSILEIKLKFLVKTLDDSYSEALALGFSADDLWVNRRPEPRGRNQKHNLNNLTVFLSVMGDRDNQTNAPTSPQTTRKKVSNMSKTELAAEVKQHRSNEEKYLCYKRNEEGNWWAKRFPQRTKIWKKWKLL